MYAPISKSKISVKAGKSLTRHVNPYIWRGPTCLPDKPCLRSWQGPLLSCNCLSLRSTYCYLNVISALPLSFLIQHEGVNIFNRMTWQTWCSQDRMSFRDVWEWCEAEGMWRECCAQHHQVKCLNGTRPRQQWPRTHCGQLLHGPSHQEGQGDRHWLCLHPNCVCQPGSDRKLLHVNHFNVYNVIFIHRMWCLMLVHVFCFPKKATIPASLAGTLYEPTRQGCWWGQSDV